MPFIYLGIKSSFLTAFFISSINTLICALIYNLFENIAILEYKNTKKADNYFDKIELKILIYRYTFVAVIITIFIDFVSISIGKIYVDKFIYYLISL